MPENENPVGGGLSPRQRDVLRILIQEYVSSAMPVGSGTLQRVGQLDVSSATIRNDLAALEELGYVSQPHTSAGRIPTAHGYRYYVEQLMEQPDLPMTEQRTITHQFHQVRVDLEQWMRLTAAVLAHAAQAASLVTPPRGSSARFRHMELISISDNLCLMVLVLQDSSIHQEMLSTSEPVTQETLSQVANRLNQVLRNHTVEDARGPVEPQLASLPEWEAGVLQRVLAIMEQVDNSSITAIYRDGLGNMLRQPEFVEADRSRQIVEILEHRGVLETILARILNANGVQIIIGGEGPYEEIDDVSLVLSPYGVRGQASGVLGVMGPVRMSYARAISAVRYVAGLMDSLMHELYGNWLSSQRDNLTR